MPGSQHKGMPSRHWEPTGLSGSSISATTLKRLARLCPVSMFTISAMTASDLIINSFMAEPPLFRGFQLNAVLSRMLTGTEVEFHSMQLYIGAGFILLFILAGFFACRRSPTLMLLSLLIYSADTILLLVTNPDPASILSHFLILITALTVAFISFRVIPALPAADSKPASQL